MLNGIDKIVYGVEDVDTCVRFFRDWGLGEIEADASRATFETRDGTEVELRRADDPALPPAFEAGSTARQVVWGVADDDALAAVARRIAGAAGAAEDDDGPSCTDPNGLRLGFRVSRRRAAPKEAARFNSPSNPARIGRRAPIYDRAEPLSIGHIVLFSPVIKEAVAFYTDTFDFIVSDYYPDAGYFLRCRPEGGHHNLFMLSTPDGKCGLNHVAFTVRDIHEVFGGGLHIGRCGWQTQIGPGRHPISSAYFWYVHNPAGGLAEYYTDEDYCTADWKAEAWERTPENFAEWAIAGGIDGKTRRQGSGP